MQGFHWLVSVQIGTWLSLPNADSEDATVDEIIRKVERRQNMKEHAIAQGIEERCQAVVNHGEQQSFLETLDYYTTVRVKCAFQMMNLDGLQQRLAEVQRCLTPLRGSLLDAMDILQTNFEIPKDALPVDEAGRDDPNALCVPHSEDFILLPVSDTTNGGCP